MRPFVIAAIVCCATISVSGYFVSKRTEERERYQAWERERRLLVALQTEVSIGQPMPRDSTLGEELAAITRQTGVPYYLDESCRKGGIRANLQLVMYEEILGDHLEPLEDAQNRVLHSVLADNPYGLNVKLNSGKLVLHYDINRDTSGPILYQRVYATPPCQPEGAIQDEATLVELVKRAIDPYSWDDVGGPAQIQDVPGGILVRNTAEVHAQVERLLSQITSLENPPRSLEPVALAAYGPTPSEERIIAALGRVADFDYPEMPLTEVMADISRRFDIPVFLATKQLEEAAINRETPVTVYLPQVSVKTFLRTCCHDLGLQYSIRRGYVRIGPVEDQCGYQIALYPVGDLLGPDEEQDMQSLREAILLSVIPDSWLPLEEDVQISPVAQGWFLVRHAREGHEELQDFLVQLRSGITTAGVSPWHPRTREDVVRDTILQKLQENFSPNDGEQSLKEFIEHLKSVLDIPVLLDTKRLEEAAINLETPVDIRPEIQPLGRQLDALLASVGLVYTIENESLRVTTPDHHNFTKEVFDVRDLTTPGSGLMSELALQSFIAVAVPYAWENGPGPGTACWYRGRLILGNYQHYLADVRSLLDYLRKNRGSLPRLEDVQSKKAVALPNADATRWERAYRKFIADPVLLKPEVLPEGAPRRKRMFGGGGSIF